MINRLIHFSIHNRLIIGLLTIALIAIGIYNFTKLPIDAVPDITNNQVQIVTVSSSLAPQEVEQFITFPVEVAMSNLQGVTEIRSISRFGLSVVTIVFKDNIDTYLARQLVSEQIKIAEGNIPEGMGKPEMMPITTGLGEIYQYVLEPEPGYEDKFTPTEIRTIQDWIVKRQLSGIPGIVEISSFGGYVKQYEVSIDPQVLVGMDITITEIFEALEKNNQNTGGSYIEKGPNSYYIRAEGLVESISDIENILIRNTNGVPVTIKDVAKVTFGAPPRFGAMTKDGKGEVVGGITLMLKGANTSGVIKNVKERVEQVRKTLPEGLTIHAYLDRSELIDRAIHTVSKNLIEGGLIVIFILVILLGNFRGGIIVATVIPLSMLFAFSMMNLFGVSANLMSLGAIDFGLIVDGSVIVVEGIVHILHQKFKGKIISQSQLDESIFNAGKRVSNSAVFGVIIILIVYLPILAFTGIEGKTFKPMAQTVSFALLGALILSLTYVPMMASLIFRKKIIEKKTFADRIVNTMHKAHEPVLNWSMKNKNLLIGIVVVIVAGSFIRFSKMGGEFIPTLEEGDLAMQMALAPGSSLSQSIETSTKAEKILIDNFPEVKEVVSKIGTAEVPTDPMAVEDADIMILLKPKKEWVSAETREELVEKMKEKLDILPGVSFEFTQPIQLRFNELMTGVKSDVAVKIYGENLDSLFNKANKAASIINNIEGAGDVKVEQIIGLPQMMVKYNRELISHYGLDIQDINKTIRTAFAGESAGVVFEGEKRFDLVVRLDKDFRRDIKSLERLRVNLPNGNLILLNQVADIEINKGPMQISRDDTKRRITVGINVRNRDVESFIEEVNKKLESKLALPPGYYITYGGQFENLQTAKRSSAIAVPIALILIFVLLYFTFHSLRQAVLIFTAIPLATVGGIWALYLRGMPFSISAGVGFIALFGVAVLNGIVLISYYNHLKQEGMNQICEIVKIGTKARLRPVIMTASVAALGFFPMALSTAPGAEVQRPLATVVIGGLITATFLTLVVLPILYSIFEKGKNDCYKFSSKKIGKIVPLVILLFFIGSSNLNAQNQETKTINLDFALKTAIENNLEIKIANYKTAGAKSLQKAGFSLPNPELDYETGQINSNLKDNYISITQPVDFPTKYIAKSKVAGETTVLYSKEAGIIEAGIRKKTRIAYSDWIGTKQIIAIMSYQDSLFTVFSKMTEKRFEAGEISILEKTLTDSKARRIKQELEMYKAMAESAKTRLKTIMNYNGDFEAEENTAFLITINGSLESSPYLSYASQNTSIKKAEKSLSQQSLLPDFSIGYFNQSIDEQNGFTGWKVGVSVPLWFWDKQGQIQNSKIEYLIARENEQKQLLDLQSRLSGLIAKQSVMLDKVNYYQNTGKSNSELIRQSAGKALKEGNISYFEYLQSISESREIEIDYINTVISYNELASEILFIYGN